MKYEYEESLNSFNEYINKCREIIINTFFTRDDYTRDVKGIDFNSLDKDVDDAIRKHRLELINIKIDHTMRMIEQVIEINKTLDFDFDFGLVIKEAVLFHDIGRFGQAVRSNSFGDKAFYNDGKSAISGGFINHGYDGANTFLKEPFAVDNKYKYIISESIKHHVMPDKVISKEDFDLIKRANFPSLNIGKIVTGNRYLNSSEYLVFSLITQLVADIDKIDILYQCLNATFDNGMLVRKYVFDKSKKNLSDIASYWGISKEDILLFNSDITEEKYENDRVTLKIPVSKLDVSKLEVSSDIINMLKNNSWSSLAELQCRDDWNFISIFIWRLGKFLNDINFTSVLITVQELELLEGLKRKFINMGNELRDSSGKPMGNTLYSLVDFAFEYAFSLVSEKLYNNKNNIIIEDKKIR